MQVASLEREAEEAGAQAATAAGQLEEQGARLGGLAADLAAAQKEAASLRARAMAADSLAAEREAGLAAAAGKLEAAAQKLEASEAGAGDLRRRLHGAEHALAARPTADALVRASSTLGRSLSPKRGCPFTPSCWVSCCGAVSRI